MHYYSFNIGDYKSHTEHLDPLEDIAYRRMIDWCFLHEKGLPKTTEEIARLIRMRTHCDCIETVLREFFNLDKTSKTWINKRVESEINAYHEKSAKAKKSAEARWNKGSSDANALRTQSEGNANHKPITNNHKPTNKEICPELEEAQDRTVIRLPTNKFNTQKEEYDVKQSQFNLWVETYPSVDVDQTLKRIKSWCINNPKRRKTHSGMSKFIDTWLAKEQDKGHETNQRTGGNGKSSNLEAFSKRLQEDIKNEHIA